MIFDSPKIQKIRQKYCSKAYSLVPIILEVDRSTELVGEKGYIEELVGIASTSKQNDWVNRLLSEDDETHIGAWFEVMLFGWLKEIGTVEIEPEIDGNKPDFSLEIQGVKVVIEGTTRLIRVDERNKRKYKNKVWKAMSQIEQPYCIFVRKAEFNSTLNLERLKTAVENWLSTSPDNPFDFEDKNGNIVHLGASKENSLNSIAIGGDPSYGGIDPEQLKKRLSKKAKQHRLLREAGYPYIIALFLEDYDLSAHEVAEAWFGNLQMVLYSNDRLGWRFSGKGKQFSYGQIQHRDVSGTLIFKSDMDFQMRRRILKSWFIQNPFAKVPIDPNIFPVESRLVPIEKDNVISMRWV